MHLKEPVLQVANHGPWSQRVTTPIKPTQRMVDRNVPNDEELHVWFYAFYGLGPYTFVEDEWSFTFRNQMQASILQIFGAPPVYFFRNQMRLEKIVLSGPWLCTCGSSP